MVKVWIFRNGPDRECVWNGEMSAIPRVGDQVAIGTNEAAWAVGAVTWLPDRNQVYVFVR